MSDAPAAPTVVATAATVGWWTWLAQTLPDDAEAGGRLLVAIVQLAIAGGAIIGGLAFDLSGYKATFELSATVLVVASLLAWLAGRNATEVHLSEADPDGRSQGSGRASSERASPSA